MTKPIKYAALCSLSLLLAACGSDTSTEMPTNATATASRISAQTVQPVSAWHDVVQRIYVGYFGRPADAGGLEFFAGRFRDIGAPVNIADMSIAYANNADIRALIDVFGTSAESQALYAGDNAAFIDAIYRNLFGRAAEQAGKDYWADAINKGHVTRARAAIQIMSGALDTDAAIVARKAVVAGSFTTSLNSAQRSLAYDGLAANVIVRTMLGSVTLSTDPAAFQGSIDSTLNTLVSQLGAQGMYSGRLTGNSNLFNSLVLENGQYWGFYASGGSGAVVPVSFVQGNGTSSGGAFSAPDAKDFGPAPAATTPVSANYSPLASLGGSITVTSSAPPYTTTAIPFTSTVFAEANYRYNQPAKLAEVAGTHRMGGTLGTYTMQIAADGSFSGSVAGCNYSGKLTPRASGKNVFDASWAFGSACTVMPGQTATGVAVSYLQVDGATRQVVIAVTNAARTTGAIAASTAPPLADLVVTDTVAGTGTTAAAGNTLTVHYTGWLYSPYAANKRGTQFETSVGKTPFSFRLGAGQVIEGWDKGMVGMKVGGKRTLMIPSRMAYGSRATNTIPANADLVFEVELVSVN